MFVSFWFFCFFCFTSTRVSRERFISIGARLLLLSPRITREMKEPQIGLFTLVHSISAISQFQKGKVLIFFLCPFELLSFYSSFTFPFAFTNSFCPLPLGATSNFCLFTLFPFPFYLFFSLPFHPLLSITFIFRSSFRFNDFKAKKVNRFFLLLFLLFFFLFVLTNLLTLILSLFHPFHLFLSPLSFLSPMISHDLCILCILHLALMHEAFNHEAFAFNHEALKHLITKHLHLITRSRSTKHLITKHWHLITRSRSTKHLITKHWHLITRSRSIGI